MSGETLGERFTRIIRALNMSKAAFARSVGVTPNYIYLLISGKMKTCSRTLALLIEAKYGYAADWVMTGVNSQNDISHTVADKIKNLSEQELRALSSYLDRLKEKKGDDT